jgi:hypothetical protein
MTSDRDQTKSWCWEVFELDLHNRQVGIERLALTRKSVPARSTIFSTVLILANTKILSFVLSRREA